MRVEGSPGINDDFPLHVHAVQKQAVCVHVQVQGRAETLDGVTAPPFGAGP